MRRNTSSTMMSFEWISTWHSPPSAIGDDRVIDPQPVVVVAFAQAADQPVAVGAHHQLLGPAVGFVGLDDDDLGPVGIGEMALEHVADIRRRHVLRFDVDRLLRGRERVQRQVRSLVDGGLLAPGREGARDGDRRVAEIRRQAFRPRIDPCGRGRKLFAGGEFPAAIADLGHRSCRFAVDGHLEVVDRLVDRPVVPHADRVVAGVAFRIPALDGQVHAADEGQRIVDADDLLVVRRIERVMGVELDVQPRMVLPIGAEEEGTRRAGRMHDRDAPDEDPDLQLGPLLDEGAEQGAERRRVLGTSVRAQADAAVEIPADDQDGALSIAQGGFEMGEIGRPIDQNRCPIRLGDAPAILSGTQNRALGRPHRLPGRVQGLQACRFFQKLHVSHDRLPTPCQLGTEAKVPGGAGRWP